MFEIIIRRLLLLVRGLLAIRRGLAFGNNDLPEDEETP
jgi:hypothetical protein